MHVNNKKYVKEGEILFKDKYISGICVFELSVILARLKVQGIDVSKTYFEIDFLKDIDDQNILDIQSYFHPQLANYLNKNIKDKKELKHFRLNYLDKEVSDFDAQVMVGGVKVEELTDSLESKLHKNLYIGGEIIDIDGNCGGYNLHFAVSCGSKIAKDILNK